MNVRLKQLLKVTSTQSILKFVPIVVPVPMCVRLRLSIRNNVEPRHASSLRKKNGHSRPFFLCVNFQGDSFTIKNSKAEMGQPVAQHNLPGVVVQGYVQRIMIMPINQKVQIGMGSQDLF